MDNLQMTDKMLEEYLRLQQEIKYMEARVQEMKVQLRHLGSFSTDNYVCAISTQIQQRIRPLSEVIVVMGPEVLHELDLIKVHTFETIRVAKKDSAMPT